jgi:hypothetical protein
MLDGAVSGQGVTSPAAARGEKFGPDHAATTTVVTAVRVILKNLHEI